MNYDRVNHTINKLMERGLFATPTIIIYGGKNEACQYVVGLKMGDCFGFQSVMVE